MRKFNLTEEAFGRNILKSIFLRGDQMRFVDFGDFCVYSNITFNAGHLHFIDLYMCGSCMKRCLYLFAIGSQSFFLKVSSQIRSNIFQLLSPEELGILFHLTKNVKTIDYVSLLCCHHWLLLMAFNIRWLLLNWLVSYGGVILDIKVATCFLAFTLNDSLTITKAIKH